MDDKWKPEAEHDRTVFLNIHTGLNQKIKSPHPPTRPLSWTCLTEKHVFDVHFSGLDNPAG